MVSYQERLKSYWLKRRVCSGNIEIALERVKQDSFPAWLVEFKEFFQSDDLITLLDSMIDAHQAQVEDREFSLRMRESGQIEDWLEKSFFPLLRENIKVGIEDAGGEYCYSMATF